MLSNIFPLLSGIVLPFGESKRGVTYDTGFVASGIAGVAQVEQMRRAEASEANAERRWLEEAMNALPQDLRDKIALFCNVESRAVIPAQDADTIYDVPLKLAAEGFDEIVLELLNVPKGQRDLSRWRGVVDATRAAKEEGILCGISSGAALCAASRIGALRAP